MEKDTLRKSYEAHADVMGKLQKEKGAAGGCRRNRKFERALTPMTRIAIRAKRELHQGLKPQEVGHKISKTVSTMPGKQAG